MREKIFEQERLQALTLIQPMGTAIVHGPKRIENRIWAPSIKELGKYFLIHAGGKWSSDYDAAVRKRWPQSPAKENLPYGQIIGAARLVGLIRESGDGSRPEVVVTDGVIGKKSSAEEIFAWNRAWYMPWQWGWILDDVFDLPQPVECRGFQKLWTPKPNILHRVKQQIREHRL